MLGFQLLKIVAVKIGMILSHGDAISNHMVKSSASYTYLYVDKNVQKVGSIVIDKCYNTL
jgi:hypothetical protein